LIVDCSAFYEADFSSSLLRCRRWNFFLQSTPGIGGADNADEAR
jgi:hypothetical protein